MLVLFFLLLFFFIILDFLKIKYNSLTTHTDMVQEEFKCVMCRI